MDEPLHSSATRSPSSMIPSIDESRTDIRYVIGDPDGVSIRFRGESMSLVDISPCGVMATHGQWLEVRKHGLLTFPEVVGDHRHPVLAHIVWSRYSSRSSVERPLYVSGFAITSDDGGVIRAVIDALSRRGKVTYDEAWPRKKREAVGRKIASARRFAAWGEHSNMVSTSELMNRAIAACRFLRRNAELHEAWTETARRSDENASEERLELLAVWEFLRRSVSLDVVEVALKLA